MFVSQTVVSYLDRLGIEHEMVMHRHTACSGETAHAAHIEPRQLAKAVLLRSDDHYVLAVVPSSRYVNPTALSRLLGSERMTFANEDEMPYIFRDCETGALPIVGDAFGIKTAVDDALLEQRDVYFEAGDHEHLVHVDHDAFVRLVGGVPHGMICHQAA